MTTEQRYLGLDVHKKYIMVAAVNAQQEVLIKPRKIATERFWKWATANLRATDVVALEASGDTWYFYDRLAAMVKAVKVANAGQIDQIGATRTKTDKRDALTLAKRLAAKLLPTVWVPPEHVRELRSLMAHRRRLVRERVAAKNRLHSILRRHHLTTPAGDPFSDANRDWWLALNIPSVDQLRVRHELIHIQHLAQLVAETDETIARLSTVEPWAGQVAFLIQLPGVGLKSAMTILSAIGAIERFKSASKLVGYAGLGASVHASGEIRRTGKITKEGRRELRATLVECAWTAVQYSVYWKAQYERFTQRMCKQKAITVIARKLLVVIWHVLSKREVDRHADVQRIARSLLTWASRHRVATSLGLSRLAFVRQQLARLGIKQPMEQMRYGGTVYELAYRGEEAVSPELAA